MDGGRRGVPAMTVAEARKRTSRPTSRRHAVQRIAAAAVAVVLGSAGTWAAVAGLPARGQSAPERAGAVAAGLGLVVTEVTVTGRRHTPREAVLAAVGVGRGDPIVSFDPADARRRLEEIGWVRAAEVRRQLPGRIHVGLTERKPAALWQRQGALAVIDREGVVLTERGVGRFVDLPLLVGVEAATGVEELHGIFAADPDLAARVVAAVRVGGRRWDLHFDIGLVLRLPAADPAAAWGWFALLDRDHSVLRRRVQSVDLRLPDRMFLRLSPEDAAALSAAPEGGA